MVPDCILEHIDEALDRLAGGLALGLALGAALRWLSGRALSLGVWQGLGEGEHLTIEFLRQVL